MPSVGEMEKINDSWQEKEIGNHFCVEKTVSGNEDEHGSQTESFLPLTVCGALGKSLQYFTDLLIWQTRIVIVDFNDHFFFQWPFLRGWDSVYHTLEV